MNKCKKKRKKDKTFIMIAGKKGQCLCEREVYSINNGEIPGLLPMDINRKGNNFLITYDVSGNITLKSYLSIPLSKRVFCKMIKSIINGLKSVQENYLNLDMLLLDVDMIMIDPVSQNMFFIYVPIQPYENGILIRDFLEDLVKYSVFSQGEDYNYVKRYLEVINDGVNFSLFGLEQYVEDMLEVKASAVEKRDESKKMDKSEMVYDPLRSATPFLLRVSTNEKIYIEKTCFRLGKGYEENDYQVAGNEAISRRHAAILNESGHYYIIDLGSTNKTFVDGQPISPEQKISINNGENIRLANEEFKFMFE